MHPLRKILEETLDILFRPRTAFDKIQQETRLMNGLLFYLFSCLVGTVLIYVMAAYSDNKWVLVGAFFWLAIFHKVQLLCAFFASQFDLEKMMGGTLPWYYYPYFTVAGFLFACLFPAAVNITVKRLFRGGGSYRNLLKSFLFIDATATIFVPLCILIAWALLQLKGGSVAMSRLITDAIGIGIYSLFLIWSVLLSVIAIGRTYKFPFAKSILVWFLTVLLFPIPILVTLFSAIAELMYPLRVQRKLKRLDAIRKSIQVHQEKGEYKAIPDLLEEFLTVYKEGTVIGDKRKKRLELPEFLSEVAKTNREDVLKEIISLSQHNRTDVRMEAVKALKKILEEDSNTAIQSIRFLITHRCPAETFLHLSEIPEKTVITRLCEAYYHLLKNGRGGLKAAVASFEETQGIKYGRELFLIYNSLYHLSEAKAIDDMIAIEPHIVEILGYEDVIHVEVIEIFKRLWEIIGYLSVYERVELGNKVPYLAAPLMILIDIGNTIPEEGTEPGLRIIKAIVPDLQNIFIQEFERLKGRADLELDLKPKRALFADEVTLLLTVRNRGNAVAENINVRIVPQSEERFSISDSGEYSISTLSPQREASIEFTIKPHEEGKLRISFEIEYNDLEKSGKTEQFADLLEVVGTLEEKVAQTAEFYNPYIVGLPVGGDMFFGREDVFQFIRQRLSGRSQKAIIVLRGQRRTGKTSVLRQLEHRLDEKYIPVFLDMQGFTDAGVDIFLYGISREIVRELKKRGIRVEPPRREQFSVEPGASFRDAFLNQVLDKIEYRHLLLLFDEFEQLEKRVKDGKLDEDIFPFLRNLMQHTERLDFIFAGTHQLQEMTRDYWSILFNIAVYQDISFMKREEAEALIRNPVKDVMYYDDLAVDKIIRVTAGHPYFVQLLCSSLTDYYLKTKKYYITLQDVNRILNDVLQGGVVHFDFIWNESSPDEQLILAVLANTITREGAAAGLSDVENTLKKYDVAMGPDQITEVVKSLVAREIVEADLETFHRYQFKIDLIRLWVNRYQSLGIIADTLKRGHWEMRRREMKEMGK